MASHLTLPGETVDEIAHRHYGRHRGTTELVLEANRGLAAQGPVLPGGLLIDLPGLPVDTDVQPVKLYD